MMADMAKVKAPEKQKTNFNWPTLAYLVVLLAWVETVALSLLAKNTATVTKYKLSTWQLHSILVAFSLPGLLIWLAILFAALSLYKYSHNLKPAKQAPGFQLIAYSFFVLLLGLIVSSLIGNIQTL